VDEPLANRAGQEGSSLTQVPVSGSLRHYLPYLFFSSEFAQSRYQLFWRWLFFPWRYSSSGTTVCCDQTTHNLSPQSGFERQSICGIEVDEDRRWRSKTLQCPTTTPGQTAPIRSVFDLGGAQPAKAVHALFFACPGTQNK